MNYKTPFDECEIIAAIARGDQFAFKKVYDHYFNKIYAFAFHVLHSKDLAEDVVQETMLKIWQMGYSLLDIEDLEGFLKLLAKRRSIDLLRKIEVERKVIALSYDEQEDKDDQTEQGILLNETNKILYNGIEKLPAQQKLAYQLCYQNGLKYKEAAHQMNISPGTVHRHMKLALKFLRNYMQEHGDIAVKLALLTVFFL